MSKVGLVLEGGALRGIYSAGVVDFFMEKGITFPYMIGVSAGMGNLVCYAAGQKGRSKKVIMHENTDSYYGLGQFRKSKKFLNLDVIVEDYATEIFPLDFETFFNNPAQLECVITNCETGQAEYTDDLRNKEGLFKNSKASCSIPFVCDPVEINGFHYMDGSIADSLPVERALSQGCDKVVVVLTRPMTDSATDYLKYRPLIERLYRKNYPNFCTTLYNRKTEYVEQMDKICQLEREGKVFMIRPSGKTIGHFERASDRILDCYQMGINDVTEKYEDLIEFMKS